MRVNFNDFKQQLQGLTVFTNLQAQQMAGEHIATTLTHWIHRGYIVRLRRGLYTFPELVEPPYTPLRLAQYIYSPSYISLQTALHYHGLTTEYTSQLNSVTTLKTAHFYNDAGIYSYQTVQPHFYYGYNTVTTAQGETMLMATPEKALLDLLHFNPTCRTRDDMLQLSLNGQQLRQQLNMGLLTEYLARSTSPSLTQRMAVLAGAYDLDAMH